MPGTGSCVSRCVSFTIRRGSDMAARVANGPRPRGAARDEAGAGAAVVARPRARRDEELVFDREGRGSVESAGASRRRGDALLDSRAKRCAPKLDSHR